MYLPYLRGRQFELIALRELLDADALGDKILPIIEPLKPNSTLEKTMQCFTQKRKEYALIINPNVGEFTRKIYEKKEDNDSVALSIFNLLKSPHIIRSYIVKKGNSGEILSHHHIESSLIINPVEDCIDDCMKIFNEAEPLFTLIPDSRSFIRRTGQSRVLFADRFRKTERNADYIGNEDEFFSEDHLFYQSDGFKGFSDYSIVGAEYKESGFAPLAVAIHIVYFDKNNVLRIHHFVSDSNHDFHDPAGKFGEALGKLYEWLKISNVYITTGLHELIQCYDEGKYPGLGTVKKCSIKHHIELMNRYLEGKSVCR